VRDDSTAEFVGFAVRTNRFSHLPEDGPTSGSYQAHPCSSVIAIRSISTKTMILARLTT